LTPWSGEEYRDGMRRAQRLASSAETGLGLVLAATPLGLWIAWTETLLLSVIAVAVVCAALLVLLTDFSRSAGDEPRAGDGGADQAVLPEGFVDEVHRLFPLTYHHSLSGSARFRRAMARLSGLIGRPRG
jgi:hypothetical protein